MRDLGVLLLASLVLTGATMGAVSADPAGTRARDDAGPEAQAAPATPVPKPAPVGTMSELMLRVLYPYSDAMFYIQRYPPKNDIEWNELAGKALALAEFGNLMMMPGRARDQDQWMRDSKLLAEAGAAALKFAKAKDVDGIVGLNDAARDVVHQLPHALPGRLRPPARGRAASNAATGADTAAGRGRRDAENES